MKLLIMNAIKILFKRIIPGLLTVFLVSAATILKDSAPPSLADHLHLRHSHDPVDKGWLADLVGLPSYFDVDLLTLRVLEVMMTENDPGCKSIDSKLRKMIFQHFLIYQHMANAQGIYLTEANAYQWAHVLAMLLKESSGDTTSISDMSGRSISTYRPLTDLHRWRQILNLPKESRIKLDKQTNFGLVQLSSDRLIYAFNLAKNQLYETAYLEGLQGAATPRKINLNTAIAIRRLIWFYQDFAQGRILESDPRIPQQDIDNPEYTKRYQNGLDSALLYCGSRFLFKEGEQENAELQKAMTTIAYCKLGNSQSGYGLNEMSQKCFNSWVTLCPNLNIDIAILTPLKYFQTRNVNPVCEKTFKRLLNKRPD